MFLYIDSLFAEGGSRAEQPQRTAPTTLNELFLAALRDHVREAVLLLGGRGAWEPMFDWRVDRRAIRVALYLQERLGLARGDPVAVVGGQSLDWLIVDYAVAGLGGVAMVIPDMFHPAGVIAALGETGPRAVFLPRSVLDDPAFDRSRVPGVEAWIDFDDRAEDPQTTDFKKILDLGGTLDTPERAQRFRQQARLTPPDQIAIRHYALGPDRSTTHTDLTQRGVIDCMEPIRAKHAAQHGDLVYIAADELTLDLRLMIYRLVGDGYSTTAVGSPERAADDLTTLRPHGVIAPSATLWRLIQDDPVEADSQPGLRQRVGHLISRARSREKHSKIRRALGGRARWVTTTTPPDARLANELSSAADIDFRGPESRPTTSEPAASVRS